jgi:hypothetical protein
LLATCAERKGRSLDEEKKNEEETKMRKKKKGQERKIEKMNLYWLYYY